MMMRNTIKSVTAPQPSRPILTILSFALIDEEESDTFKKESDDRDIAKFYLFVMIMRYF